MYFLCLFLYYITLIARVNRNMFEHVVVKHFEQKEIKNDF